MCGDLRSDFPGGAAADTIEHGDHPADSLDQKAIFIAQGMAFTGNTIADDLERETRLSRQFAAVGASRERRDPPGAPVQTSWRETALIFLFLSHPCLRIL